MIKKWHARLDKIVSSSKAQMVFFVLMFGSFLIGLVEVTLGPEDLYVEGVMIGASGVLTFVSLLWYFEAKIKEDNAKIAANHAEAERLEADLKLREAELDAAILDIELRINDHKGDAK